MLDLSQRMHTLRHVLIHVLTQSCMSMPTPIAHLLFPALHASTAKMSFAASQTHALLSTARSSHTSPVYDDTQPKQRQALSSNTRIPRTQRTRTGELRTGHGRLNLLLVGAIAVIAAEAFEPKLARASVQGCEVSAEAFIWQRATLLTQQVRGLQASTSCK